MRHTRNRQMFKLTKHKFWKETYNLPIWEVRKWAKELDHNFQWRSWCHCHWKKGNFNRVIVNGKVIYPKAHYKKL